MSYRGYRILLALAPVLAAAAGGPLPLALALAGAVLLWKRGGWTGYLMMATGPALAGGTPLAVGLAGVAGASLALLVPAARGWEATGSRRLLVASATVGLLSLYSAAAIAVSLSMLGAGAIRYTLVRARLSRVTVSVGVEPGDPVVGGSVRIVVVLTGGDVVYHVRSDLGSASGSCRGSCRIVLEGRVSRAGLVRVPVVVRLRDPEGYAEASSVLEASYVALYRVDLLERILGEALRRMGEPRGEAVVLEVGPGGVGRAGWLEEALRARALPGWEYLGVREYYPGDMPKMVHWKKSASRRRLYTRLYGAEMSGPGRGGPRSLVYVDLRAAGPEELDRLILEGYAAVLALREEALLVLVYPGGALVAGGPAEDIAHAYDIAVRRIGPEPLWIDGERGRPPVYHGSMQGIVEGAVGRMAERLMEAARRLGWERGGYVLVYGSPGVLLAGRMSRLLSASGSKMLSELYSTILSLPEPV